MGKSKAALYLELTKPGIIRLVLVTTVIGFALGGDGVPTEVVVVEELGSATFVFADIEHRGEPLRIRIRVDADYAVARGDRTHVNVVGPVHVFGSHGLRLKTAEEQKA